MTVKENDDTLYWCKILKGPELEQKHHIIGFEPILSSTVDKKSIRRDLIHHMTLFECTPNVKNFDLWSKSKGIECNSKEPKFSAYNHESCITPVASWSKGSSSQFLPPHVGISFSGKQKYYMLEIHYDNPLRKTFSDSSGLRVHYTKVLRKYEGGVMINGVAALSTQLIPPKQKYFHNLGICGPSCTSNKLNIWPVDGINIISISVQTHSSGIKYKFSHIRNETELDTIVEDNNYNYNFQEVRQLENETKVISNDYLIINCTYDTKK